MIRNRFFSLVGLCFIGLTAASASAAEPKDNPEYTGWAKFKPGTVAVYSTELSAGDLKVASETTNKLVEVKPDKLVLESSSASTIGGQVRARPAKKKEVPAKKEPTGELKDAGEEDVEVAGKKLHCKVKEGTGESPLGQGPAAAADGKGKFYFNDTVPGGVVKMVLTSSKGSMTITLKSFEVK